MRSRCACVLEHEFEDQGVCLVCGKVREALSEGVNPDARGLAALDKATAGRAGSSANGAPSPSESAPDPFNAWMDALAGDGTY